MLQLVLGGSGSGKTTLLYHRIRTRADLRVGSEEEAVADAWAAGDVAAEALSRAREEIDALNVYPVPDGDTGTNMFLTMSAAREGQR